MMASAAFSSIRPMRSIVGDENKNQRNDERADKLDSKVVASRPLAPIDSNQPRQTHGTSTNNANRSQKLLTQSQTQPTDDSNTVVTIEEVRKNQDGSITIHRYARGKLLGKVRKLKSQSCAKLIVSPISYYCLSNFLLLFVFTLVLGGLR
jgi:hypothetical protein